MIIRCGGFPNVPLMGTQGAINYNPELVPRQAGYPMALSPFEESITPFISMTWKHKTRGVSGMYDKLGGVLLEQARLTFRDPQLNTNREPHSSHAGLHGPLKRKSDDSLEHPSGKGANKKACRESWSRLVSQERSSRVDQGQLKSLSRGEVVPARRIRLGQARVVSAVHAMQPNKERPNCVSTSTVHLIASSSAMSLLENLPCHRYLAAQLVYI
ncbi:hypothetical protein CR513_46988, partial [Mucuna pruriens]